MKEIALANGKGMVKVDDSDYELVIAHKWSAHHGSTKTYAKARINNKIVAMHRLIMNVTDPTVQVDHINGDSLDNRRENLRICSNQENLRNRGAQANNKSGYKGVVCREGRKNPYIAQIAVNKKNIYLGSFECAEDAALAYDIAARDTFGEFAYLNFPEYNEEPKENIA